ncbi:MAG TPA: hypothetical protein VLJ40_03850 [Arthrobacter sp.]|nr:hypothetical protein [Arthrobacter sp.]
MIYLLAGVWVASTHGYLVAWNVVANLVEGIAAILVWPVVLFLGVNLHHLIA